MGWVRLSDDFYDHPKFDKAGPLGIALFTAGLAWCNRNLSDGFIPASKARLLLDFEGVAWEPRNAVTNGVSNGGSNSAVTRDVAVQVCEQLVDCGLWRAVEGGFEVHDYLEYQYSAKQIQAQRESNAARQKRFRGSKKAPGRNGDRNGVTNGTVTHAPNPNPIDTSSSKDEDEERNAVTREDVERLCAHLADRIEGNGAKRPTITKRWRDSARLLLDRDKRTEAQVTRAIDWCQDDEFWRANILSMPKLREKYDQLQLKAKTQRREPTQPSREHLPEALR